MPPPEWGTDPLLYLQESVTAGKKKIRICSWGVSTNAMGVFLLMIFIDSCDCGCLAWHLFFYELPKDDNAYAMHFPFSDVCFNTIITRFPTEPNLVLSHKASECRPGHASSATTNSSFAPARVSLDYRCNLYASRTWQQNLKA